MRYYKLSLLAAAVSVMAAIGFSFQGKPAEKQPELVQEGDDFKLFMTSSNCPEGRWLTLVSWEEIQDSEKFDDLIPFWSPKRVLAVKGDKCAVISRRTATDRINLALKEMK